MRSSLQREGLSLNDGARVDPRCICGCRHWRMIFDDIGQGLGACASAMRCLERSGVTMDPGFLPGSQEADDRRRWRTRSGCGLPATCGLSSSTSAGESADKTRENDACECSY